MSLEDKKQSDGMYKEEDIRASLIDFKNLIAELYLFDIKTISKLVFGERFI